MEIRAEFFCPLLVQVMKKKLDANRGRIDARCTGSGADSHSDGIKPVNVHPRLTSNQRRRLTRARRPRQSAVRFLATNVSSQNLECTLPSVAVLITVAMIGLIRRTRPYPLR